MLEYNKYMGFPGGSVARIRLPIQETGLIPGPGRAHMLQNHNY